jgi:regulator of sirC expression with transglutaminase-like and TPR domain
LDVLKPLAWRCFQQPHDHDDDDDVNASSFDRRLLGFLAARCLQNVHFAECLHQWKEISEFQERSTEDPNVINAIVLERYALLVGEIQQSPPDLLLPRDDDRSNDDESVTQVVVRRLDEMAETCRRRIVREQETSDGNTTMTTTKRLQIVNEVLIQEYQLSGNQEDYYNYRNSLLHHVLLKSKKGIPITLCIIYVCVCRRMDIYVHLIGLPGHVVLGYAFQETTTDKDWGFLDVFRDGQLLTLHDCIRICASYGVPWSVDYLTPLPATAVLQRILNNLTNCHFQAMSADLPFHSDLFFQQRALDAILRQPHGIAGPLVDRVTQELPLTLSPDLLRYYGLLSPQPEISSSTTTGD